MYLPYLVRSGASRGERAWRLYRVLTSRGLGLLRPSLESRESHTIKGHPCRECTVLPTARGIELLRSPLEWRKSKARRPWVRGLSCRICVLTSRGLYLLKGHPCGDDKPKPAVCTIKRQCSTDCILTSCSLELLRSPLERRQSKTRRPYHARTVL